MLGFFIFGTLLFGEDSPAQIRMPDIVLDAIRHCECLQDQSGSCNPYVIRINDINEAERAKQAGFGVKGHLILCGSGNECALQAQALIDGGINNLDLGPYQINYKFHPYPFLQDYFEDSSAREKANEILTKLVKSFGYSWETLGRYHHAPTDVARNARYYRKMYAYIYGSKTTQSSSQE